MRNWFLLVLCALLLLPTPGQARAGEDSDEEQFRESIIAMKESPRGPFSRIRWFCNDGEILPPEPYACTDHGGGRQHGEWSGATVALRDAGFHIATVLAAVDAGEFVQDEDHGFALKQMIVERFLIAADDGWIMRGARSYRGALQEGDERAGGRELLLVLAKDPSWKTDGFPVLREAVRTLPHGKHTSGITELRQLAATIAETDEHFQPLRNKLHTSPDAGDAQRIREYARQSESAGAEYDELAGMVEEFFLPGDLGEYEDLPAIVNASLELRTSYTDHRAATDNLEKHETACRLLAAIRDEVGKTDSPEQVLTLLDLSIALEEGLYRSGADLLDSLEGTSRRTRLTWVQDTLPGLYGIGFLSKRQVSAARESVAGLLTTDPTRVRYQREIGYLTRISDWSKNSLHFHFSPAIDHLEVIEPLSRRFIQDRLHASFLLQAAQVLDQLARDGSQLLGREHHILGKNLSSGVQGLNPGLARGTLRILERDDVVAEMSPDSICVIPHTTGDLPRVAGIVTLGSGNSLSHAQLLARNLGVPNVVVAQDHLALLKPMVGKEIVLAVSPGGVVRLEQAGSHWDEVLERETRQDFSIRPDLDKLDLKATEFYRLKSLRASDSGRVCGPKAANLGELKNSFPDAVAPGVVIPFGVFRTLLNKPVNPGGPPMFEWMRSEYARLEAISDQEDRNREQAAFLEAVREWIEGVDLGWAFQMRLKWALNRAFGEDGTYGVFVRSDTNVEDLPGFTGAGLNLTVPNVVGFEQIMEAIRKVWASPFTERAFGWRQGHMQQPEHVYVSVLLMKTVPVDKSGVLVTRDVATGSPQWLTIAVNEGVGGAVAGQNAEELLVHAQTGRVRLLAQASEPLRRVALPEGGLDKIRAAGPDELLGSDEIETLLTLARTAPTRFKALQNEAGETLPADIEFGFINGELALFQIRPFVTSSWARSSRFLNSLDHEIDPSGSKIDLDGQPEQGAL
ncbi:MAG: PEP/pyruvate-binding domain-containing protein [Desulfovibrionales bacterium]